ncbi:flagellar hook-associated protein FlgK [Paenirhodobacter populi]|uniref:Flagellar hook-associated protein 1 n=1 Tax=Paenirhodobacter populi TaxID=2306993 RepID=A0A443JSZ2_9RHOB|nr:flagellar hook-associated protein FlgK [Sinirhodobacter populi]RWR23601.1 flagellar hook-associated protein FlgK [Sinirhodobacter populi]
MSITNALNNAVSGLSAMSRMTEVIASNTANALTEGYARREVQLSSANLTGGVRIDGIARQISESLLQEKRQADAAASNATTLSTALSAIEGMLGTPGDGGSLSDALSAFDSALISAAATPENATALSAAVDAAKGVTEKLNAVSEGVQSLRLNADTSIGQQVQSLNDTLAQIADLNKAITRASAVGNDASSLMDQRQVLVNQIEEIVPIRSIERGGNQIALYTTGGLALLDGTAATIEFSPAHVMGVDISLAGGQLSGLSVNGRSVTTTAGGLMAGGSLAAAFEIRDELAPQIQTDLDAFARNLIERFSDSSLTPTAPGLFTDAGNALDLTKEAGLAQRISINAAVDPAASGEVWRLRDGLAATSEGAASNATLLGALSDAFSRATVPASGSFSPAARSVTELAADLLSRISTSRQSAESRQSYLTARQETVTQQVLSQGVDTDRELQTLLQVEQAYAANARVIQAVDEMMQAILEL